MELYGLKIRSGTAVPFFSLFFRGIISMALFLHGIFGLSLVLWVRSRGLAFAIPLTPSHGLWAVFVWWNRRFWGLASPSHRTHPWNDSPLAGFIENSCRSFRIYYLSVFVNGRRLKVSNVAVGNSFQSFRLLLFRS